MEERQQYVDKRFEYWNSSQRGCRITENVAGGGSGLSPKIITSSSNAAKELGRHMVCDTEMENEIVGQVTTMLHSPALIATRSGLPNCDGPLFASPPRSRAKYGVVEQQLV